MEFAAEMDTAVQEGIIHFKQFITQKLNADKNYLRQSFWVNKGLQTTVLNYLLRMHQESDDSIFDESTVDLTDFIDFVIENAQDKNAGEPLHLLIESGKIQLAQYLLDKNCFDIDRRDEQGRTLLSLALATRDRALLAKILKKKPNVHATTRSSDTSILTQPLHEAIILDYSYGVTKLANSGAQLDNPHGPLKETPLLLAARLGKIKALRALLEFPAEQLYLEAESEQLASDKNTGHNAIESLCALLIRDPGNKELIRGIAMLLCRGAEPPRNEYMCQLLANNRRVLLKEIDRYLDSRPDLVDPFVNRCHFKDSPLHKIVYVDHSWGNSLRQLLGRPSESAFIIEKLITRKYNRHSEDHLDSPVLPKAAAATLTGEELPLKLYAEFVRRYSLAYDNQKITNPWSTMRWMIAQGECNWDIVKAYATDYPGSRTGIIFQDMFKTMPKMTVHDDLEQASVNEYS